MVFQNIWPGSANKPFRKTKTTMDIFVIRYNMVVSMLLAVPLKAKRNIRGHLQQTLTPFHRNQRNGI